MKINTYNSEVANYLNTLNVNYVIIQMDNRLMAFMINQKKIVIHNSVHEIFEYPEEKEIFLEGVLKENDLTVYINLNNVELVSSTKDETVFVRMTNGVELILRDKNETFTKNFNNRILKRILR